MRPIRAANLAHKLINLKTTKIRFVDPLMGICLRKIRKKILKTVQVIISCLPEIVLNFRSKWEFISLKDAEVLLTREKSGKFCAFHEEALPKEQQRKLLDTWFQRKNSVELPVQFSKSEKG